MIKSQLELRGERTEKRQARARIRRMLEVRVCVYGSAHHASNAEWSCHHPSPTNNPLSEPQLITIPKQTAPYWSSLCKLRAIVDALPAGSPRSASSIDRRFGRVEEGGSVPLAERLPRVEVVLGLSPSKVAGVLQEVLHELNADLWEELQGLLAP